MDNKVFGGAEQINNNNDSFAPSLQPDVPVFNGDAVKTIDTIENFSSETVPVEMPPSNEKEEVRDKETVADKAAIGLKILNFADDFKIDKHERNEIKKRAYDNPAQLNDDIEELSKKMQGRS